MTNLTQIIEQIKLEIKVDADGKGRASLRSVSRLCGVSVEAISKAINSVNLEPSKLAAMLISKGFDSVNLVEWKHSGIPDLAVSAICSYYAMYAGRYITEEARLACEAFQTIGDELNN
jgi:hypothetical protein